jgi:deoxyribonuclease IV
MKHRYKIGFKAISADIDVIPSAQILYDNGFCDYIELYVRIDMHNHTINKWKTLNIPYVIHGPHMADNVNLAQKVKRVQNLKGYEQAKKYADALNSEIIIVHSGNDGDINESISQVKEINDSRICIENKPKKGLNGEICIGHSYSEMQYIISSVGNAGFVLDMGHALYASNTHGTTWQQDIEEYLTLEPKMFHFSDGDISSEKDLHLNLSKGNFDLKNMLKKIKADSKISLETPRKNGVEDFILDVECIRGKLS